MSSSNTSRMTYTRLSTYSFNPWPNTTTLLKNGVELATSLLYKPNKKDPHNIAYYRPIALMNGILKLGTSILTNIGSPRAEAQGTFSDTADEFKRHRKIYDSLSTHIMMYEDAKFQKNIYTQPTQILRVVLGAWIA